MTEATALADDPRVLEVEGLEVTFRSLDRDGASVRAVDGIDFGLRSGEVLSLIGESGSGKSATILALSGLLPDWRWWAARSGSRAARCSICQNAIERWYVAGAWA